MINIAGIDLSAIKVKVTADTSEAQKGLGDLKKTGESLYNLGTKLSVGLTAPLVAFGTLSVKAASDLKLTQQKTQTIFGDMTKDVQSWAMENERSFGLGSGTIEGMAGKIADLTQGMGLAKDKSLDMAKGATELAVQLGNWNGIGADTAMDDITRAVSGSHKAVEKYGVKLTETVLNEKARAMGLGDTFSKLSEAEKAQVRYNAIIDASGNAVQFWKDGNRSLEFSLGEIKEQTGNIMENIGGVFLPIVEKVVEAIADWTAGLAKFTAENPKATQAIAVLGSVLTIIPPILIAIGKSMTLFASFPALVPVFAGVAAGAGLLGVAFLGLNKDAQTVAEGLPTKINEGLQNVLQKLLDNMPQMLAKGQEMLFNLVEGVANGIPILLQTFVTICMNTIETIFTYMPQFQQKGLEFVQNMLTGAVNKFPEFLGKMLEGILNVLKNIAARMPDFMQKGADFVVNMINGIANNLPSIVAKIGELLVALIGKIIEYLPKFLAEGAKIVVEIVKGLWDNKGKIVEAGGNLIKACWDACVNAVSSFMQIGSKIVDSIKSGISGAWGKLTGWISGKLKSIPVVGGLFSLETPNELSPMPAMDSYGQIGVYNRSKNGFVDMINGLNAINNTRLNNKKNASIVEDNSSQYLTFNNTFNIQGTKEISEKELSMNITKKMEQMLSRKGLGSKLRPVTKF